jgi:hypothetical protein
MNCRGPRTRRALLHSKGSAMRMPTSNGTYSGMCPLRHFIPVVPLLTFSRSYDLSQPRCACYALRTITSLPLLCSFVGCVCSFWIIVRWSFGGGAHVTLLVLLLVLVLLVVLVPRVLLLLSVLRVLLAFASAFGFTMRVSSCTVLYSPGGPAVRHGRWRCRFLQAD